MTPGGNRPVRIAVVGGGSEFARRRMIPAMSAATEVDIVAVASRDANRAAAAAGPLGAVAVTGYGSLLERAGELGVDAVYLPLPLALHARWAEAALESGCHVLCEKPVGPDEPTARRLYALAASRGLALAENVLFVHHGQHRAAAAALADGVIGTVLGLTATFTIPALPDSDVRYDPHLGGGSLRDVGLYPLRLADLLLGAGLEVAGAVLRREPGRQVETSGAVLLRDGAGRGAQLRFGMENSYESSYVVHGSHGSLSVRHAFTPPAEHQPDVRVSTSAGAILVPCEADDQVANGLAAFVAAVRAGGSPAAAVEASLRQAALVDEVERSARQASAAPVETAAP